MRSIPFKVVAMLGLNDGQYPRQSKPLDFDLMAQEERRVGDRSRRGDDRYLFLEALISARSCLYLSYQGVDSKNNSPRQPSLVLSELMDYLTKGYGWNFNPAQPDSKLRQLPLHSFSEDNFNALSNPSFETSWLRLLQAQSEDEEHGVVAPPGQIKSLTVSDLVRFLENPGRTFANQSLGLYLHDYDQELEDDEPFDSSKLVEYQLRQHMLTAVLSHEPEACKAVREEYQLNGQLPESHLAASIINTSQEQAEALVDELQILGYKQLDKHRVSISVLGVTIEDQLPLVGDPDDENSSLKVILSRPTKAKSKDRLTLWLTSLIAQVAFEQAVTGVSVHLEKNLELQELDGAVDQLHKIMALYKQGLTKALALDAELGEELLKVDRQDIDKRRGKWQKKWYHNKYSQSFDFSSDPYRRWLWPQTPKFDDWHEQFSEVYQPMVDCIKEVKHA